MDDRQSNPLLLVAVAGIAIWFMSQGKVNPAPTPTPGGSLRAKVADANDAKRLAGFYHAFADAIRRDTAIVKTVGAFRTGHTSALLLAFQGTNLHQKYGIGSDIDARLAAAIGGLDDGPLDATKRAALTTALESICTDLGGH